MAYCNYLEKEFKNPFKIHSSEMKESLHSIEKKRLYEIKNFKNELHNCYIEDNIKFEVFHKFSACIKSYSTLERLINLFQQGQLIKEPEKRVNLNLVTGELVPRLKELDINTMYRYFVEQGMETEKEITIKYFEILQSENAGDRILELVFILLYLASALNLLNKEKINNLKIILLYYDLVDMNQIVIDKTIDKEEFDVLLKMNFIFSEYIDCFVNFNKLDKSGIYDKFFVGKYACNNMKNKKQEQLISSKLESDYSKEYEDNSLLSEKDVLYMKYLAMKAEEYSLEGKMLVEEFMALDEKIKKGYKLKGFELLDLVVLIILGNYLKKTI